MEDESRAEDDGELLDWPAAMLGPPPWQVDERDWDADLMDIAVGKFIRELPLFELMLKLTRHTVEPGPSWVEVYNEGPSETLNLLGDQLLDFPKQDHFWLDVHFGQAAKVLELRNAIMHGLWHEGDRDTGSYRSVRPVRSRKEVRKLLGGELPSDDEYPTVGREFNAGGVMAGRARARSASRYLNKHLDRWEVHFAGA